MKRVAIAGATGAVGTEMLKTLEKRNFPVSSLKLLASERSVGRKLVFKGKEIAVELLRPEAFDDVDIVLSSTSGTLSKQFSPAAVERGAVVVDNTSAFRMDPNVPLVVPEVNPEDIKWHKGIIANPNCSTIIANVPLFPIYKKFGLKRFVSCTYQAVSGAGAWGIEELREQTKAYLNGEPIVKNKFPHQIAFNVFSHNSAIGPDGFNEEEAKMIRETRKIFHDDSITISATCVRVPVFRAHTEALHCELKEKATPDEIRELLSTAPGVKVIDDVENNHFPMPIESTEEYEVRVGRIRTDYLFDNGIAMLISGDQLLKGAAFNAVQIAELLLNL
ncbi:aspartate-semialdehyde dehydrogenase [bacterium]|nr:aspartate-semialdehyde dehydrogenase [bacterium]